MEHILVFFRKFRDFPDCFEIFVSVVSLLYWNREFRWFDWTRNRNNLIESILCHFYENLGLFRFVSKQFCLFWLFLYRFETPKQTEIFCFYFTKQTETNLVSVFFGSNRIFLLVSRTPYLKLSPEYVFLCTYMKC